MKIWALLLCLAVSAGAAEAPRLTGRVIERIACTADTSQTYALYVPTTYTPAHRWPVIFCFDPGARGSAAVERLREPAERFGFIVAGSNNSRNGPWHANLAAMQAMVNDVEHHLATDPHRVFAAGLSGGARVAAEMGFLGWAQGVIGCSAGFPAMTDGVPRTVPFAFFGSAGTEDFNHRELQRLDQELGDRRATHRIVFFDGGHEWAPLPVLAAAVEWLEIQSMRSGAWPKDPVAIRASFESRLTAAHAMAPGPRSAEFKSIVADFSGLLDTGELDREAKALDGSKDVKAWRRAERALVQREEDLNASLDELASDGSPGEMRRIAEKLRAQSAAPEDSPDRQMVRRTVAGSVGASRDKARDALERGSDREAIAALEFVVAFRPDQSRAWFDLAAACARVADRRRALEALAQAAKAGFSDTAKVDAETAFEKLRNDAAFQSAVAAIRANPAERARSWEERP